MLLQLAQITKFTSLICYKNMNMVTIMFFSFICTTSSCLYINIIIMFYYIKCNFIFHPSILQNCMYCRVRVTGMLEHILESQVGNIPDGRTVHQFILLFYST